MDWNSLSILPLPLVGYLLAARLFRDTGLLERLAWTVLFSMVVVQWVVFNISVMGDVYITGTVVGISGLCVLALLVLHAWRHPVRLSLPAPDTRQVTVLAATAAVSVFAAMYYTNAEFLLSLPTYFATAETKCFYMQTFKVVGDLNPAVAPQAIQDMYGVISTPGNALFTAGLMPGLGIHTFHVLYVAFNALVFLFTYLLLRRWTGRHLVPLVVALFAVFNPCALSIEVLDRNFIALALSAALLYACVAHRDRVILHGFLFGIAAGTGLRFLPLTLALPVALLYRSNGRGWASYVLFLATAAGVFAFNIPHLEHHGFHSLGETQGLWGLFLAALDGLPRTPLMPYPNAVLYLLNGLGFLGFLVGALVLTGALDTWRAHPRRFASMVLIVAPTYLVLSLQRDWIEGDKLRILLWVFLPVMVFLASGLRATFRLSGIGRNLATFALSLALVIGVHAGLGQVETRADTGTYQRKPRYQTEAPAYVDFLKRHFRQAGLLPDYGRLFQKGDLARKDRARRIVQETLFGGEGRSMAWTDRWLSPDGQPGPAPRQPDARFVDLRIDLEKLVTDPDRAVALGKGPADRFVDLEDEDHLLDVYHKQIRVSWQPEPLPVTVLTGKPEYGILGELDVDLNAFISFGPDEDGFERVNLVPYHVVESRRPEAVRTAMTALPQSDREPVVVLRVPLDTRILIRNWLLDAVSNVPFRVDGWAIALDGAGRPQVRFYPFEPESYL